MIKKLRVFRIKGLSKSLFLGIVLIFSQYQLCAEEDVSKASASQYKVAEKSQERSSLDLVGQIFIYLALFAASALAVIHLSKKGKFASALGKRSGKLKIEETHVLGNKQFLVVVEYEKEKILLGVGPGMINRLCYLTPRNENQNEYFGKTEEEPVTQI